MCKCKRALREQIFMGRNFSWEQIFASGRWITKFWPYKNFILYGIKSNQQQSQATSHYSSLKLHYNSMAPLPHTPCIPIPHASYPCHSLLALPHFCVPAHDLLKGHSSTGCFESLRKERRGEERRGEERRGEEEMANKTRLRLRTKHHT